MRASRRSGRLSRMATACNEEGLAEARSSSTSSRAPKLSEHEPARQTRRRNPQTSRGAGLADGFDATAGIADAGQEERNSDVADCASVILVLDSWLQALPWESLSMLQRSTIYRSPSLSCAVALQSLQGISDEGMQRLVHLVR